MVAKSEKFLISPGFPINFKKSHRLSKNYLKSSKSYGQEPLGVPEDPLSLNRVKIIKILDLFRNAHVRINFFVEFQ